jgi:multiple sugar transport system permease protein
VATRTAGDDVEGGVTGAATTAGLAAARLESRHRAGWRRRGAFPYLALVPAALFVVVLMALPIGETIWHSFTSWDGITSNFIGLRNFTLIIQNPITSEIFLNSLFFLVSVPLILLASLLAAVMVYEKVAGWRVFRFLFFIPAVLSPAIVGALFSTFFLPGGAADQALRFVGLGSFAWLTHPWTARLVVILALVWTSFGFGMVVILSALATIDTALYDAAAIDGAGWWRRLWSITIPMVSGSLQFLSVINVIYTFTSLFTFVFVITAGGPGFATTTIDYYTYITTFENGQFGYGAALAVLLFLIVLVLTIAQIKLFPRRDVQQGS